jgi:hypothetical protein
VRLKASPSCPSIRQCIIPTAPRDRRFFSWGPFVSLSKEAVAPVGDSLKMRQNIQRCANNVEVKNTPPHLVRSGKQLAALAAAARQEIVDVLEQMDTVSVAALAAALGRPADALYFHLRALTRAVWSKTPDIVHAVDATRRSTAPLRLSCSYNTNRRIPPIAKPSRRSSHPCCASPARQCCGLRRSPRTLGIAQGGAAFARPTGRNEPRHKPTCGGRKQR